MNRRWHRILIALSLGCLARPRVRDRARLVVHRFVSLLLLLRSRPLPQSEFRRCVVVAPHPDDETLGCGGAILARCASGATVSIVLVTDGSGALEGPAPGPNLVKRRHAEFLQATGLLGVKPENLHFLHLKDGSLSALEPAKLDLHARSLATLLNSLAADELFVTSRDDGSSEHEGAFRLVAAALARSPRRPAVREYPIWSWWNPLLLLNPLVRAPRIWRCDLGAAVQRKAAAVAVYTSQTEPPGKNQAPMLSPLFVRLCLSPREYFITRS